MTAGSGILHEEFHSPGFAKSGGPMKMVQLWVNLPVAKKMTRPAYQSIVAADIPTVALANGSGVARIITGELDGAKGPARTFKPINVWDARLDQGKEASYALQDRKRTRLNSSHKCANRIPSPP